MIRYEWVGELDDEDRGAVLELVAAAADYDEEAGFTSIDPALVRARDGDDQKVRHLAIKARADLGPDEDGPLVVVAYLHLSTDDAGMGTVSYVVHPDYRSRGITTLLVEEIGLDLAREGGWRDAGASALRCWAYATHPASERLTRRFGVPAVSRQWTLMRHLTGPYALPLDPPEVPAAITLSEVGSVSPDMPEAQMLPSLAAQAGLPDAHRERLVADWGRGGGYVVAARDEAGQVLGLVWFGIETRVHLELRAAPVYSLLVAPDSAGKGVATALLLTALGYQRDHDVQLSTLRIDPDDAGAVRLCRLLGYEQEDAHACYQVGDSDVPVPAFS